MTVTLTPDILAPHYDHKSLWAIFVAHGQLVGSWGARATYLRTQMRGSQKRRSKPEFRSSSRSVHELPHQRPLSYCKTSNPCSAYDGDGEGGRWLEKGQARHR